MKKWTVILLSSILLAACSSSGNPELKNMSHGQLKTSIVQGVTTKQDMQDMFGSPNDIQFHNEDNVSREYWEYRYDSRTPHAMNYIPLLRTLKRGADLRKVRLIVFFDENDKVKRYTFQDAKDVQKAGWFGR